MARTQEDLLEALQALLEAAADPELTSEKRLEACRAWSKAAIAVTASTKADKSYVELSKIERPDVMASFRQIDRKQLTELRKLPRPPKTRRCLIESLFFVLHNFHT